MPESTLRRKIKAPAEIIQKEGSTMPKQIKLIHGIEFSEADKLKAEFKADGENLTLTLSAEDYPAFFQKAVQALAEPIFFFAELPAAEGEEYKTYYLDNCTLPVIKAILKRYGGILYSDGVLRFGFGSNKGGDEVYMQEYQQLSVYSGNISAFKKIISELGYCENPDALTLWDIISEQSPISGESVECEGETAADMIDNLRELGLYQAE